MPHGWIILDKPLGLGSTQAVGAVKRVCREAGIFAALGKVKVGHGGTLDPLATGVLPIALGEATKLCGRMLDASKTYEFTVQFGEETSTLDAEGEVVSTSDRRPPMAAVAAVLEHNTDPVVPGMGSAIFLHVWSAPGQSTSGCVAAAIPAIAGPSAVRSATFRRHARRSRTYGSCGWVRCIWSSA